MNTYTVAWTCPGCDILQLTRCTTKDNADKFRSWVDANNSIEGWSALRPTQGPLTATWSPITCMACGQEETKARSSRPESERDNRAPVPVAPGCTSAEPGQASDCATVIVPVKKTSPADPPEHDMFCDCGARAHSEWTWVEWYSDTMCGQCWREERADEP